MPGRALFAWSNKNEGTMVDFLLVRTLIIQTPLTVLKSHSENCSINLNSHLCF